MNNIFLRGFKMKINLLTALMLGTSIGFGSISPTIEWGDVPPTNSVSDVVSSLTNAIPKTALSTNLQNQIDNKADAVKETQSSVLVEYPLYAYTFSMPEPARCTIQNGNRVYWENYPEWLAIDLTTGEITGGIDGEGTDRYSQTLTDVVSAIKNGNHVSINQGESHSAGFGIWIIMADYMSPAISTITVTKTIQDNVIYESDLLNNTTFEQKSQLSSDVSNIVTNKTIVGYNYTVTAYNEELGIVINEKFTADETIDSYYNEKVLNIYDSSGNLVSSSSNYSMPFSDMINYKGYDTTFKVYKHAIIKNALGLAEYTDIPTNNTQLINGSGYITLSDVQLIPIYDGNGNKFSSWTINPNPGTEWEVRYYNNQYTLYIEDSPVAQYSSNLDNLTNIVFTYASFTFTVNRIVNNLLGYKLPQQGSVLVTTNSLDYAVQQAIAPLTNRIYQLEQQLQGLENALHVINTGTNTVSNGGN